MLGQRSEPDPFIDAFTGLIAARALSTAVMLGVFDGLHESPATPAELADRLGLHPLGTETLLTTLTTLGYVEPDADGRVRNTQVSEVKLVSSSPESIANFIGLQCDLDWEVLDMLPAAVRDGEAYALHEERHDDAHWEGYMRGLFEISRHEQEANAKLVQVESPRRMVDVAGGHGGFAMAMCRLHPGLEATVLDLPPAAAIGRRIVAEQGLADRVEFVEGDVFELGLGTDLDVVSFFNLIHHLPEERNRELIRMSREALRPGGVLVIGDSARPEPGDQLSPHGAVSSLLFYAWSHSRNFSPSEARGWLEQAGFEQVDVHRNIRSLWRMVVTGR
jgi:SAM-dependent methyltransferase